MAILDLDGAAYEVAALMARTQRERDSFGRRLLNAGSAGGTLAEAVAAYVQDPEAVGTNSLAEAYTAFMGQHSAGFTDSAREAVYA